MTPTVRSLSTTGVVGEERRYLSRWFKLLLGAVVLAAAEAE